MRILVREVAPGENASVAQMAGKGKTGNEGTREQGSREQWSRNNGQGTGTRERCKAAAAMAETQVERCMSSSLRARSISTKS